MGDMCVFCFRSVCVQSVLRCDSQITSIYSIAISKPAAAKVEPVSSRRGTTNRGYLCVCVCICVHTDHWKYVMSLAIFVLLFCAWSITLFVQVGSCRCRRREGGATSRKLGLIKYRIIYFFPFLKYYSPP